MSKYSPPEGFTLDPNSGRYYKTDIVCDTNTGASVQWVTWFDAYSGEYEQVSYPIQQQHKTSEQPIKTTPQQLPENKKIIIGILGVAAILILIFILVYAAWDLGDEDALPDTVNKSESARETEQVIKTDEPDLSSHEISADTDEDDNDSMPPNLYPLAGITGSMLMGEYTDPDEPSYFLTVSVDIGFLEDGKFFMVTYGDFGISDYVFPQVAALGSYTVEDDIVIIQSSTYRFDENSGEVIEVFENEDFDYRFWFEGDTLGLVPIGGGMTSEFKITVLRDNWTLRFASYLGYDIGEPDIVYGTFFEDCEINASISITLNPDNSFYLFKYIVGEIPDEANASGTWRGEPSGDGIDITLIVYDRDNNGRIYFDRETYNVFMIGNSLFTRDDGFLPVGTELILYNRG